MEGLFKTSHNGNCEIVLFERCEVLYVQYLISEVPPTLAIVSGQSVLFLQPSVAVVEGLKENEKGMLCKHLRFVRDFRNRPLAGEMENGYIYTHITPWGRLRVALKSYFEPQRVRVLGGFENVVIYDDEIAVPDYSVSGSGGWIVKKRNIEEVLKMLPPLVDSGERGVFYIRWEADEDFGRIVLQDPSKDPGKQYARITYDKGSLVVKEILINGSFSVDSYSIDMVSNAHAQVGRRIPHDWREEIL